MNSASTVLRGLCVQFSHGANIVALPEETGRNGENKPVPKVREAHFYSTMDKITNKRDEHLCKTFKTKPSGNWQKTAVL